MLPSLTPKAVDGSSAVGLAVGCRRAIPTICWTEQISGFKVPLLPEFDFYTGFSAMQISLFPRTGIQVRYLLNGRVGISALEALQKVSSKSSHSSQLSSRP